MDIQEIYIDHSPEAVTYVCNKLEDVLTGKRAIEEKARQATDNGKISDVKTPQNIANISEPFIDVMATE